MQYAAEFIPPWDHASDGSFNVVRITRYGFFKDQLEIILRGSPSVKPNSTDYEGMSVQQILNSMALRALDSIIVGSRVYFKFPRFRFVPGFGSITSGQEGSLMNTWFMSSSVVAMLEYCIPGEDGSRLRPIAYEKEGTQIGNLLIAASLGPNGYQIHILVLVIYDGVEEFRRLPDLMAHRHHWMRDWAFVMLLEEILANFLLEVRLKRPGKAISARRTRLFNVGLPPFSRREEWELENTLEVCPPLGFESWAEAPVRSAIVEQWWPSPIRPKWPQPPLFSRPGRDRAMDRVFERLELGRSSDELPVAIRSQEESPISMSYAVDNQGDPVDRAHQDNLSSDLTLEAESDSIILPGPSEPNFSFIQYLQLPPAEIRRHVPPAWHSAFGV